MGLKLWLVKIGVFGRCAKGVIRGYREYKALHPGAGDAEAFEAVIRARHGGMGVLDRISGTKIEALSREPNLRAFVHKYVLEERSEDLDGLGSEDPYALVRKAVDEICDAEGVGK